jgi:hypothetical protein
MFVYLNEATTDQPIAINPQHVVAVFEPAEGEMQGKTIVNLVNGGWAVSQTQLEVVSILNSQ